MSQQMYISSRETSDMDIDEITDDEKPLISLKSILKHTKKEAYTGHHLSKTEKYLQLNPIVVPEPDTDGSSEIEKQVIDYKNHRLFYTSDESADSNDDSNENEVESMCIDDKRAMEKSCFLVVKPSKPNCDDSIMHNKRKY